MRASTRCAARSSKAKIHLTEDEVVDTADYLMALAEDILDGQVERFAGKELDVEEWDIPALIREVSRVFGIDPQSSKALDLEAKSTDEIGDAIWALAKTSYDEKEQLVGADCCAGSSATSCCRSSTRSGRTTSTRSTT